MASTHIRMKAQLTESYHSINYPMDEAQSPSPLKDKLNAFISITQKEQSLSTFAFTVLCCLALLLINIHNPTEYYSEYQHEGLNRGQSRTLVGDEAALTDQEFISQKADECLQFPHDDEKRSRMFRAIKGRLHGETLKNLEVFLNELKRRFDAPFMEGVYMWVWDWPEAESFKTSFKREEPDEFERIEQKVQTQTEIAQRAKDNVHKHRLPLRYEQNWQQSHHQQQQPQQQWQPPVQAQQQQQEQQQPFSLDEIDAIVCQFIQLYEAAKFQMSTHENLVYISRVSNLSKLPDSVKCRIKSWLTALGIKNGHQVDKDSVWFNFVMALLNGTPPPPALFVSSVPTPVPADPQPPQHHQHQFPIPPQASPIQMTQAKLQLQLPQDQHPHQVPISPTESLRQSYKSGIEQACRKEDTSEFHSLLRIIENSDLSGEAKKELFEFAQQTALNPPASQPQYQQAPQITNQNILRPMLAQVEIIVLSQPNFNDPLKAFVRNCIAHVGLPKALQREFIFAAQKMAEAALYLQLGPTDATDASLEMESVKRVFEEMIREYNLFHSV